MQEETVILENRLSELIKLQRAIDAFGKRYNLSKETVHDANLVLEETMVNVISYAYENEEDKHSIVFKFNIENEALILSVEDDGKDFDPLKVPEPLEKSKIGGPGIHLIRNLARSISHFRHGDKNLLIIRMDIRE